MSVSRRPILVAPDSFKGWAAARSVAEAIGRGLGSAGLECDLAPIADGGEGTAAVLVQRLGGVEHRAWVHDPLGREIEAAFVLLGDGRAVVEVAAASGFGLVAAGERDAEASSSGGTGELIVAALEAGARQVLVEWGRSR
jgi:glycerate kinase